VLLCALVLTMMESPDFALAPGAPQRLRVDYLSRPLGLGNPRPTFSWEVNDPRNGARQTAYELVLREGDREVWASGRRPGGQTAHVEYGGPDLPAFGRYFWRVRTWDSAGAASPWSADEPLGIGPISNSDWRAKWITDGDAVPPRAKANNGYHSEFAASADAPKWVGVNFADAVMVNQIRLYPARPHDWVRDAPGFLFPVRFVVEVSERGDYSDAVTVADYSTKDFPNPGERMVTVHFGRFSARAVRVRAVRLAESDPGRFGLALAEMEVWDGEVMRSRSERSTPAASDSLNQGDWGLGRLVDGDLRSHASTGEEAMPPLEARRRFEIANSVRRATLYFSAKGAAKFWWNGQAVNPDDWLAPEWTDYFSRIQYVAHDVTSFAKAGAHELRAIVGDGWYSGRIGMSQMLHPDRWVRGIYGRRPELLAEIHLEYADGTTEVVATGDDWDTRRCPWILSSDIYDGERQDLRPADADWGKPIVAEIGDVPVVAMRNEPIRTTVRLRAVSASDLASGGRVYDMGQNMVGTIRTVVNGKRGDRVRIRYAEMLNDDGTIYTANLRGAPQVDEFILAGIKDEILTTYFTYHGFRYVEITGLASPPDAGRMEGLVFHSDSPVVGSFECSDPLLNQIWRNVLWTQRANLMSSPTDCPQRDERLGWMGDILVFGQAAAYNMDVSAFYRKWMTDVRDAQATDGRFPDIAPHPYGKDRHFTGAPGWGDAGVVVPWRAYENTGDLTILRENVDSCMRWVDFVLAHNPGLIWKERRGNDYNDWLNGNTLIADGWPREGGEVPRDVFATIMFAHSAELTGRMLGELGRSEDALRYRGLAARIRKAFCDSFLAADGTILGDTQAGYALALFYDMLPADREEQVFAKMVAALAKYGDRMSTGFHSSHALMLELSDRGRTDLAFRLAQSKAFPSWGYSVEQGATTIWERWDGYVKGRGFQDPGMNSFNHWAFGAVTEWLMKVVIGIRPGEAGKDWREFVIEPHPGQLTHAKGSYRSLYGLVEVAWRRAGGRIELDVTIPANTMAEVRLPDGSSHRLSAGRHRLESGVGGGEAG